MLKQLVAGVALAVMLTGTAMAAPAVPPDQRAVTALANDFVDCLDRSINACTRIINSGIDDALVDAHTNRGLAYDSKGDYDRAIADYDQAIRLNLTGACDRQPRQGHSGVCPDIDSLSFAYSIRGKAYYKKGDYDRAIADYDQTIRLNPNCGAHFDRAVAYTKKADTEKALSDFRIAARICAEGFPAHDEALQQIAVLTAKLADVPNYTLCRNALNYTWQDWDAGFADVVAEAQRRNLSVDDCRVAIGLPPLSPPP